MNNKKFDLSEAAEQFIILENKYNLHELSINGVYFWKLIRQQLLYEVYMINENVKSIHLKLSKTEKIKSIFSMAWNTIFKNPFLKKNTPIIVFEYPRKIALNNKWIDPYTHYFLKHNREMKYLLLERRYVGEFRKSEWSTNTNLDYITFLNLIKKRVTKVTVTKEMKEKIKDVEKEMNEMFGVKLDLELTVRKSVENFLSLYTIYNYTLKKKKPKQIIIVCSYGQEALIAAAQYNNIKVVEFQHGVMVPSHLGYHFPVDDEIKYFPDEIVLFGEFWAKNINLPKNTTYKIGGYPYLKERVDFFSKQKNKNEKQILFISQGTIGKQLSSYAFELAKSLEKYTFVFKLHPGEFGRWRKEYPELIQFEKLPNTSVVENQKELYEIFNESKLVIGVSSTAIYESLAFGLKPIIMKLSSHQYMKKLYSEYNVPLLSSAEEIVKYINSENYNKQKEINVQEFFADIEDY